MSFEERLNQKAKKSAYIETISYHDFLTNNLHPTKEEIIRARKELSRFDMIEWVPKDDVLAIVKEHCIDKQKLQQIMNGFPIKFNEQGLAISLLSGKPKDENERKLLKIADWFLDLKKVT